MKISEVRLKNFRNVESLAFNPHEGLNFLIGENGQGKTSILEGMGFLSTLRSFRGAKGDEVIRHGESWAEAACWVDIPQGKNELKISFAERNGRVSKTAFIDGKPIRSSTQYLSARFGQFEIGFHSIVFNPSDHDLVRGEPALRRAYLDRTIAAEDSAYLQLLSRYQKALEQRNALLKGEVRPSPALLSGFTETLIETGAQIARFRVEWLSRLQKELDPRLKKIVPGALPLRAFYVSNWVTKNEGISISSGRFDPSQFALQTPLPSLEFFQAEFRGALEAQGDSEWRAGLTLVGPHRDDLALFYGQKPLRGHGSQGETRSALITLKLCEIDLFRNKTGHRPVLLLDDFSSELDRGRREFLLRYLSETDLQVFVTSTEAPPFDGRIFVVSDGSVKS
jgi:DNA replication and repair protein RecF